MAVTKKKLRSMLECIGWKLVESHNGLNDFIMNHKGKRTWIAYRGDHTLEFRNDKQTFGTSFAGSIRIDLNDCDIELNDDKDCVTLMVTGGTFIQFNNFDNINKKKAD